MTKIFLHTLLLFVLMMGNFRGYAQETEVANFYFSEAQPVGKTNVASFAKKICGDFVRLENDRVNFCVTNDSIYARYPVVMSLTLAEIRSSGKYEIRGNEIFGVHESKGLPVKLFQDTAVFVHYQQEVVFRIGEDQILREVDGVYYLNYKMKDALWSTMVLKQFGNSLCMYSLDHSVVMDKLMQFKHVRQTQQDGLATLIATPTSEEFLTFFQSKGFTDKEKYIRKTEK